MANEEQLSILKQGVDVWNNWREENPDVTHMWDGLRDDFGKDLRDADLHDIDLRYVNFSEANRVVTVRAG